LALQSTADALQRAPKVSIEWLARQSSLGQRQFERRCRAQTGASPKLLARIGRFDRAFHTKFVHPERDWLTVAIDCGYFDYQDMVRDFKDFTGQTPPQALAAQRTAPERRLGIPQQFHVTDPDALAATLRERKLCACVGESTLYDVPRRPSSEG
jgi:AraC-like DNA-binding protein